MAFYYSLGMVFYMFYTLMVSPYVFHFRYSWLFATLATLFWPISLIYDAISSVVTADTLEDEEDEED